MKTKSYFSMIADGKTIYQTLKQNFSKPVYDAQHCYRSSILTPLQDSVHPNEFQVRVAAIRQETPSTKTFVLVPQTGNLPPFLAGQYVNVKVVIRGVKTSRPLSISSGAKSGESLELTVKTAPAGFFSPYLNQEIQLGDSLTLNGPEGDFCYSRSRDGKKLVFIAGGCGITPEMAMLEDLLPTLPDLTIHLFYSNRTKEEVIFHDRLNSLAQKYPNFHLHFVFTQVAIDPTKHHQRLNIDQIFNQLGEKEALASSYFICGTQAMQQELKTGLMKAGLPSRKIRLESFSETINPAQLAKWPAALTVGSPIQIRIQGIASVVTAPSGEPLLNSLERAGVKMHSLCRSGSCGACRVKLVAGSVTQSKTLSARPTDKERGYIHACQCYATSNVTLKLHHHPFKSPELFESYYLNYQPSQAPAVPLTKNSNLLLPETMFPIPSFEPQKTATNFKPDGKNRPKGNWTPSILAVLGIIFFSYLVISSGFYL